MTARPLQRRAEFRIVVSIVLLRSIGSAASAVISEQHIEADRACQDRLRAPELPVATEQDAAGACDGVKDRQWGFRTQHEHGPRWQLAALRDR